MDVGVVGEQALHGGVVEVRAVVDGGDGGRGAAEDFGLPCVLGLVLVGNWEPVKGGGGVQVSRWLSKWITETGP